MRYNKAFLPALTLFCLSACSLGSITDLAEGSQGTTINNKVVESPEGARWIYWGAISKLSQLVGATAADVALFTDELARMPHSPQSELDTRAPAGFLDDVHIVVTSIASQAQATRVQLQQAIHLLNEYGGANKNNMKAHSYGMLGMVHLILADNYCSGIPLSESKWGGEFTPGKGYPTDTLFQRAVSYADSGLSLNSDSAAVVTLLTGVKARALNSLGRYEDAARVAAGIGDSDAVGEVFYSYQPTGASGYPVVSVDTSSYTLINRKGQNGIEWIADAFPRQDMRVPIRSAGGNFVYPLKPTFFYGSRPIMFASGAEARLMEAEHLLASNDIPGFMEKINSLRRMFKTGSGTPLPDTVDPGSLEDRINLLFRERAFTLYMSGRRLGDMRRLVRQYGRNPEEVWPMGRSEGSQIIVYGQNYVFTPEVPGKGRESTHNSLYFECESYAP